MARRARLRVHDDHAGAPPARARARGSQARALGARRVRVELAVRANAAAGPHRRCAAHRRRARRPWRAPEEPDPTVLAARPAVRALRLSDRSRARGVLRTRYISVLRGARSDSDWRP